MIPVQLQFKIRDECTKFILKSNIFKMMWSFPWFVLLNSSFLYTTIQIHMYTLNYLFVPIRAHVYILSYSFLLVLLSLLSSSFY